jgi:long-chain acyl-CoA synthetase
VAEPCAHVPFMAEEAGRWRSVGWEEAGRRVEELAAGFLALGVRPGDRVAILGRTRLEWTLADFALISTGAVVVPVYQAATPADRAHVLSHSAARMLVCEDAAERERIARLPGLGHLERALTMDGSDDDLAQLGERGRRHLFRDPGAVARARAAIREEDLLTLVYTSGTTGPPKGCMLTHRNYRAMVDMTRRIHGLAQPGDVVLLHLPLAHVFARLVQFLAAAVGMTIAFCPDASRLGVALRAVRPTLLPSVPRLFEAMHTAVLRDLARGRGPRRRLVGAALGAGREAARRRREGRQLDPWLALRLRLADRLVFSRIRSRLGGRLRYAVSGGAKLVPEVAELFEALGVLILEGYGLTECTTVAAINRPDRHRVGTVGPPVPGVELRVAADGEILVRGENVFAGYHLDEAGTREVLDGEGWLRTGDVGSLDADGFLTITDRKKDIIVTSEGENVPPQRLETALRASPYISEALVVGDGRPYLVALLSPNLDEIRPAGRTDAEVRRLLGRVVADVNRGAAHAERVRGFAVLPRELRAEEGELTPTLKARRHVCEEHFRDLIESLYADARPRPPSRDTGSAAGPGEAAPPDDPPRA